MENPFKKKIDLEFTANFTSPVLGNVWVGRKESVAKDLAEKFIKNGVAKVDDGKSEALPLQKTTTIVKAGLTPAPVVDPYKGMNAAQKKVAQKKDKEIADAAAKAAAEKAAKDKARVDELLDKTTLTDAEEAELKALEAASFEAEGKGK